MVGVVGQHLVKCCIHVAVSAALAELRRTWGHDVGHCELRCFVCLYVGIAGVDLSVGEEWSQAVGGQFAGARQLACEASENRIGGTHQSFHQLFHKRLSVFSHEQAVVCQCKVEHHVFGQWILRQFQYVGLVGLVFHHIVVCNAACNDAEAGFLLSAAVECRLLGSMVHVNLLVYERYVFASCYARQQHPLVGRWVEGIHFTHVAHFHGSPGVCQSGHDAQQYRHTQLLRQVEGISCHVVCLLLVGWFEYRYHGKLAIEAAVLLVLARMHRGVVGREHHQSATHASDGAVDKRVGTHVHSHVFHTHQGTPSGIAHAQCGLHGCLLVCAPAAVYAALTGQLVALYVFCDFGAGRTWIGIYTAQPCMYGPEGHSLVAK